MLVAAVALGVALYVAAFALVVAGDALGEAETLDLYALVLLAGLVFTATGAIAAARRPDNRTGAQMLVVGLLWSLGALQATDKSVLFTVGFVVSGVAFAAFAYLILAYPTGVLRAGDRWLVLAVLAAVTLGPLAITLVDPTPLPACEDCPESAFLVTDQPDWPPARSPSRSRSPPRRSSPCSRPGWCAATWRRRRRCDG